LKFTTAEQCLVELAAAKHCKQSMKTGGKNAEFDKTNVALLKWH